MISLGGGTEPSIIYTQEGLGDGFRQCEFITGLTLYSYESSTGQMNAVEIQYAIVASQDCDLIQDYNSRQGGGAGAISNVLLFEAEPSEAARLNIKGSDIYKRIVQNKDERYQYVRACDPQEDFANEGLPSIIIDFRRFFTLPTAELYWQVANGARRRTRLIVPYREHLQSRIGGYLCRVVIPEPHKP